MTTHRLIAWVGEQKVGALGYHDATGRFSFIYDADWVTSPNAFPISPALPFQRPNDASNTSQTDELHSVNVRRFFENLLPEGKALEDVATVHGVSKGNIFGLLRWLGKESTGALCLLPEQATPRQNENSKREVTFEELSSRIRERANRPFNIWDARVRMSIAGHQDKLAVYQDGDRLFLVEGQLASTHILKPEPLNLKLASLVANEHFCLQLAAKLGIAVAHAEILRVPEPVLLVKRFDRIKHSKNVERLHVIDSCQALNLGVDHKYERNFGHGRDVAHIRDGVSLAKLFSIARLSQSEAVTRMALLRWTLFQYLIGNSDAHGKNLSFLVEPGGLRIAPAYDLVAVSIYPDIEHELAMAIGDEFNLSQVRAFDWADFARNCALERRLLVREIKRVTKTLRAHLSPLLNWPGYTEDERNELEKIAAFSLKQTEQLARDAELITTERLD